MESLPMARDREKISQLVRISTDSCFFRAHIYCNTTHLYSEASGNISLVSTEGCPTAVAKNSLPHLRLAFSQENHRKGTGN